MQNPQSTAGGCNLSKLVAANVVNIHIVHMAYAYIDKRTNKFKSKAPSRPTVRFLSPIKKKRQTRTLLFNQSSVSISVDLSFRGGYNALRRISLLETLT